MVCFTLFGTYLAATFAKLLPVAPKEAPLKYPSSAPVKRVLRRRYCEERLLKRRGVVNNPLGDKGESLRSTRGGLGRGMGIVILAAFGAVLTFPFRGKAGMGVGAKRHQPIPTLALPLKGRE